MDKLDQVLFQTFIAFFAILILTRILGKQQINQLTFYEYINGITFGSIAASLASDTGQHMVLHLAGLIFFGILTGLMAFISLKSRPLRKLIAGEPVVVIQNGKILENNLKKMRYNLDELTSELRSKNVFDIADVELALIEPSGKLSILKYAELNPPTRQDFNIPANSKGLDIEVVMDGKVIYTNLEKMGLDGRWLLNQLENKGIESIRQVAYASVDANHQLFVDTYEDKIEGLIDISDDFKLPLTMDTTKYGEKDEKS